MTILCPSSCETISCSNSSRHGSQDSESDNNLYSYNDERQPSSQKTVIAIEKPVPDNDFSFTGENYDPLSQRDIARPTS